MSNTRDVCPVCSAALYPAFRKRILNKYLVNYYECKACGLLKTEQPYWLSEAYTEAISDLDTGLVQRNLQMSALTAKILTNNFAVEDRLLDYGGGYGLFVRLMRDLGFDFYWTDEYCLNIFARQFMHSDSLQPYEAVTAFEVLEHIVDPMALLRRLAALAPNILISTQIRPPTASELENWWYLVPETGQHVTFFTVKSLNLLAMQLGLHFYSNGCDLHLFSRQSLVDPFLCLEARSNRFIPRMIDRLLRGSKATSSEAVNRTVESLTWADHLRIRDALRNEQELSE